ncbi:MAG TPA: glutamine--tRNA ligase/YqeY domain fusion protein [Eubacteriales bacterium]|nr:glutamine--tRNA ligase/YqeY domain fusion protein [Eubacteriales bacterium]
MANNFIEEIIEKDLESGKVKSVQTRFPPEPNGYLHIGHAKSLCINFGIKAKYNGKCFLRFDDTNPVKEDLEYVNSIKEDIKWLGFNWDDVVFASDYFEKMYDAAVTLIKKGKAFVCDYTADQIRETRGTEIKPGTESPWRNRSIEENLDLFTRMRNGEFADGERILRAKIDMASANINMRDPVIYRIVHATHHNTGDRWCIYPMYDFAHPIEDAVEGTTHSICSLEFEDHRPLYDWVINECGFANKPQQIEFAKLFIKNTIVSKRFLKRLVAEGQVMSWDDPRMPTLCGMRRRGYPPEAIRDFCDRVGVAKANSEIEQAYLEACVRENLNLNANRVMAVLRPLKVELTNYDENEKVLIENNPNAETVTQRELIFGKNLFIDKNDFSLDPPPKYYRLKKDGYVRLKGAYIIHCDEVVLDEHGEPSLLRCSVVNNSKSGDDQSGLKVKGVIQWVNAETCLPAEMRQFESLLLDATDTEDFMERLNPKSLTILNGYVEESLNGCKTGERFQFLREGYYCVDRDTTAERIVFNQTVGLKDNFNK